MCNLPLSCALAGSFNFKYSLVNQSCASVARSGYSLPPPADIAIELIAKSIFEGSKLCGQINCNLPLGFLALPPPLFCIDSNSSAMFLFDLNISTRFLILPLLQCYFFGSVSSNINGCI